MSRLKLTLNPNPTFAAAVLIPIPGAEPAEVVLTFKYKTKSEYLAWVETISDDDVEAVQSIVVAWDLSDEFTAESIRRLSETYMGSLAAIIETYVRELTGNKLKN